MYRRGKDETEDQKKGVILGGKNTTRTGSWKTRREARRPRGRRTKGGDQEERRKTTPE